MAKLLSVVLLLFTSIGFTASQPGFWSINCGGSRNYTDEFGISWTGDEQFLQTGETRIGTHGNSSTFRVFTSQRVRKNCYSIPVGKGKKILVRIRFDDGKANNPPEFDVIFDGNTVDSSKSIEVIYIARWESTKICLGRTKSDQDPFVSKIEIRTLREDMYSLSLNYRLRLFSRIAFGADKPIRYPDDQYDRIWTNRTLGYTVVKSDLTNFTPGMTENVSDHVPSLLLASGIESNSAKPNLTIPLDYLPPYDVDIYNSMYFTEMSDLAGTNNTRIFNITYNGRDWVQVKDPPYRNFTWKMGRGTDANNTSAFVLVPISSSTLPPIISAMEIYTTNDASEFDATEEDDVKSLYKLQEHFPILGEWNGDPCLPVNYNWEWIGCIYFTTPFVSVLNLSGYGLSGEIPDFSDLRSLMYIDLSNNNLAGEIPDFLANFTELKYLNLANNDFDGKIPTGLSKKNESVEQIYKGNPKLSDQAMSGVNIIKLPNGVVHNLILYLILTLVLF